MPDELDLDLDLDTGEQEKKINRIQSRIKDLSEKVALTAKERDEKDALVKQKEVELANISKERDFFASFSDSVSSYPAAKEYKDQIKDKVMAGYSVEDATVSVLNKEGKLTTAPSKPVEKEIVAGGSAINNFATGGQKSLADMTREEKRQALLDAEAKGDISVS